VLSAHVLSAHTIFTTTAISTACPLLASVATGAWLFASASLVRSFDLSLPRALTVSLAGCLVASTTLDACFALANPSSPLLQSSTAVWVSNDLTLFVSAATALVAHRVWQSLRWIGGRADAPDAAPYRAPGGPEQEAAKRRARRAAFDAAQGVRLHTASALACAAAGFVGVVLSVWVAPWHKFYADCTVRQSVGSLSLVALLAMVLTRTTSGIEEEGARRLARGLSLVSLAAWGLALVDLDRLIHYMTGDYGDAFYARLEERDSLFRTMEAVQTLAQVTAIGALVAQAASYSRAASSMQDSALARRASRLALLVGLLALAPISRLLLENSDSIALALFAESSARSPFVQGSFALGLVSVAAFYRSVSRSLASAFDGRAAA